MLTADEQAELEYLQRNLEQPKTGLTADEEAELELLQEELKSEDDEQSFLSQLSEGLDKYTGSASARSGVKALIEGKPFFEAVRQPFQDYSKTPTGTDIASQLGFSQEPIVKAEPIEQPLKVIPRPGRQTFQAIGKEKEIIQPIEEGAALGPSPAQIAGTATDIALDPSFAVGKAAKGIKAASRALGVTGKMAEVTKSAASKLTRLSRKQAFKSAGAMLKDFRKQSDRVEELGKRLIDEDLIKAGDDVKKIAQRAGDKLEEVDEIAKGFRGQVSDNITTVDFNNITENIRKKVNASLSGKIGKKKALELANDTLDEIAEIGTGSFQEIIEKRREIDELINYGKRAQDLPINQKVYKTIRDSLNDQAENILKVADAQNGTDLAKQFRDINKRYSEIITIKDIADDKAAREAANRFLSLGDRITGGAGIVTGAAAGGTVGSVIGGAALAGAARLARTRGGSAAARFLNLTANAVNKAPDALGKYSNILIKASEASPERFAATVLRLRRDDDFRKRLFRLKNERKK